jgi:hypothetical protein
MIYYLINCTSIWLLSLLTYDLFLRRSTFHLYNRFYLLSTLLAGICIPLFSFAQKSNFSSQTKKDYGLEKTFELKSNLVAATQTGTTSQGIDWETGLWLVYLFGLTVSMAFMLKDLVQTFRLYAKGNKSFAYGVVIIETQKEHSPFSFFGYIFLSSMSAYTDEQLSMILTHEKCHNRLWHGADLLFIQLCKVVFWFHPLPYFYSKRLLMVHEYQADRAVEKPIAEYGSFLVEQTIFAPSPNITHSFYHSPIKKRILMLTRKSSTMSKSKVLLAIPVFALSIICFSKDAFSDGKMKKEGNKIIFKGNVFELYAPPSDTSIINNPTTGKKDTLIISMDPYPIKMNEEELFSSDSVDERPVLKGTRDNMLVVGVFKNNETLLSKLDDGEYRYSVPQVVIGKGGELLYYIWEGLTNNKYQKLPDSEEWGYVPATPASVKTEIDKKFDQFIANMKCHPAIKDGKAVNCSAGYEILGEPIVIVVKNHVPTIKISK